MNLLIKFPTRSRRQKFLQVLSLYQRMKRMESTRFLITCDENDSEMNNESARKMMSMWGNMDVVFGNSTGKVNACNRDLNEYDKPWDIILLASDDMIPKAEGFDQIIVDAMIKYFPDTDGVLYFWDGFTPLNTLCIIGRKYYDRFKYIYNPEYISLWCDNEFMEVADRLGKQVFIREPIIRHEHYSNGHGKMDRLMLQTERHFHTDKATFEKRKERGFDLNLICT